MKIDDFCLLRSASPTTIFLLKLTTTQHQNFRIFGTGNARTQHICVTHSTSWPKVTRSCSASRGRNSRQHSRHVYPAYPTRSRTDRDPRHHAPSSLRSHAQTCSRRWKKPPNIRPRPPVDEPQVLAGAIFEAPRWCSFAHCMKLFSGSCAASEMFSESCWEKCWLFLSAGSQSQLTRSHLVDAMSKDPLCTKPAMAEHGIANVDVSASVDCHH